ncbi:uncharacterized protein LOC132698422 [Cylas formicarius]|uniref:uncharacterized protein LOC132698422 n=1 Tax=Cylas formicarius TaxID=197179 RepID=UPI0029587632|nr:uncharacterized protein LOC132698422 [Cylas formicarius]
MFGIKFFLVKCVLSLWLLSVVVVECDHQKRDIYHRIILKESSPQKGHRTSYKHHNHAKKKQKHVREEPAEHDYQLSGSFEQYSKERPKYFEESLENSYRKKNKSKRLAQRYHPKPKHNKNRNQSSKEVNPKTKKQHDYEDHVKYDWTSDESSSVEFQNARPFDYKKQKSNQPTPERLENTSQLRTEIPYQFELPVYPQLYNHLKLNNYPFGMQNQQVVPKLSIILPSVEPIPQDQKLILQNLPVTYNLKGNVEEKKVSIVGGDNGHRSDHQRSSRSREKVRSRIAEDVRNMSR